MKILLSFLMFFFLMTSAWSQLSINAEIRPRAEIRNGYKSLNTDQNAPALLIGQRTRLAFFYTKDWLATGVSFQDVRLWGDETLVSSTGVFGDNASVDMNEAWLEMRFFGHSAIKVGRQYFEYDDARLLAKRNWNQNSISYDGLLYKYNKQGWAFDAAFSLNNNKDNKFGQEYPSGKFKTLDFLHLQKTFGDFKVSGLALMTGVTKNDTSETLYVKGSFGMNLNYKSNPLNAYASVYYQCGKNGEGNKVHAYNINASGTYIRSKLRVSTGFSMISGNKPSLSGSAGSESDRQFDLLYGARHRYYGEMDYFNNVPGSTGGAGLIDVFAIIDYNISAKMNTYLGYHYFANQYNILNGTNAEKLDRSLASEFDLGFLITFTKVVNLNGGVAILLPNQTLEIIQGVQQKASAISNWVWVQLIVKPEFVP
ncbi:MAG: alginate export family protein [Bacteroidales bacterium]|nr:alginate export family protein [Bacteroidales bacterium]